ncbi:MAG TPA: hypothetical protein VD794_03335 [Flavisolibacter sp.]|nr:hypothetical protein [Flavisolibacter sp.]
MKTIIYLLLLLPFMGCKKDDDSSKNQLRGIWLLKKSIYSSGGLPTIVNADPNRPVQLTLRKDGTFSINTEPYLSPLQRYLREFDYYQVFPNNELHFKNRTTGEEIVFQIELGEELELSRFCREACSDYFVRSY